MAQWSDVEQLMLELVNRARLDPSGEAARFGIGLNDGLAAGTLSGAVKQALAPSEVMNDAARAHSQWMLNTDTFSHTGINASNAGDRIQSAGYAFTGLWTWGENIAWQGTTGTFDITQYLLDENRGLFLSPHHRENILNGGFREVGIGAVSGEFSGYNALMTSQDFARSGSKVFVTGVAYNDGNADHFYGIGEARAGVLVSATVGGSGGTSTTAAAGGYAIAVNSGLATVALSGGGLAAPISVTVDVTAGNAKVDLVDGMRIETSATATLGANATSATLLGAGAINLTGNAAANVLSGNTAANRLDGGDGNDTLIGGSGSDGLWGGTGNDSIKGGYGSDRLMGQTGNDILRGEGGSDTLVGGYGSDTLWGGAGQDIFILNAALGASNIDRLADFNAADDTIGLDHAVFSGTPVGALLTGAFVLGAVATGPGHHIVYDKPTGALYFDADGAGGAAQVKFATLAAGTALTTADFEVL